MLIETQRLVIRDLQTEDEVPLLKWRQMEV